MTATAPALTLAPVCKARWMIHTAGCNNPGGGIDGQVTKCRLSNGVVAYVRENLARDHFYTSSNERIGMKKGDPTRGREVLELCCAPEWWEAAAALVAELDPRGRRVRRNRNFTAAWAERVLAAAARGA